MFVRIARGQLPVKPHTELRGPMGELRYEHCLTRDGFDGPFSILYHTGRPHAFTCRTLAGAWPNPRVDLASAQELRRRHLRGEALPLHGDSMLARAPLLFNSNVVLSRVAPDRNDECYFSNADGDELFFVQSGAGSLISPFGRLAFTRGDYVLVPKSVWHRFELSGDEAQNWLSIELHSELGPLPQFRNRTGQLRMDAPYSHRDFRVPDFVGPEDCALRRVLVKRGETLTELELEHSALDVVGYDGTVYPWALSIHAFQPRVGSVHLPPTAHATFQAQGVLICSFVPRWLDFGPGAIPYPYPHSSVDVDEVLYYASGQFTSRSGVGPGSVTWHPRGLVHGPQAGRYEASLGVERTEELAVMLDCALPLQLTDLAAPANDPDYERSFSYERAG
jgi:homogentisate 1,2-dioxygenase